MLRLRCVHCLVIASLVACRPTPETGASGESAATGGALPEGHVPVARAVPLTAEGQATIDSGNTAFSEKRYTEALALYRRTVAIEPGHPAPWFGIYMAAGAMGDTALADSARRLLRIEEGPRSPHSGGSPQPSGSPHATPRTG